MVTFIDDFSRWVYFLKDRLKYFQNSKNFEIRLKEKLARRSSAYARTMGESTLPGSSVTIYENIRFVGSYMS